jgi:hypothetical protein
VRFLVDAAVETPPPAVRSGRSFDERVGWMIELTERRATQRRAFR